ncbi:MAG: hypothetical protein D6751_05480 [Deltaproteobacteria bacterium]|nr:MAG: hypothetical protein D6751_05480 [Deltaproteobacteria bacterium]
MNDKQLKTMLQKLATEHPEYRPLVAAIERRLGFDATADYQQFISAWWTWHVERFGVKPRMSAAQGKAMKEIIRYLSEVTNGEDLLGAWEAILSNWSHLSPFLQRQTALTQINKNLVEIIAAIKQAHEKGSQKAADSIRGLA